MRILYVAMRHDYGRPEAGDSFEEVAFHDPLRRLGHDVIPFDFMALRKQVGRRRMNAHLLDIARAEQPDVLFCVPCGDDVTGRTLHAIRALGVRTACWFCDDHWRFDSFSRHYARHFDLAVTTDPDAVARYHALGIHHTLLQQWACNDAVHRPAAGPPLYDISFVGMAHGQRRVWVDYLHQHGLTVHTWGTGWPSGRLSPTEMVEVFSRSRINLNFAESSTDGSRRQRWLATLDHRIRYPLLQTPGLWRLGRMLPTAAANVGQPQIKARVFEVLGSGGFLLTESVAHLDKYLTPGRELVTFCGPEDLVSKCRHYLAHERERSDIAAAGCARVRGEHTYAARLSKVLDAVMSPQVQWRAAA